MEDDALGKCNERRSNRIRAHEDIIQGCGRITIGILPPSVKSWNSIGAHNGTDFQRFDTAPIPEFRFARPQQIEEITCTKGMRISSVTTVSSWFSSTMRRRFVTSSNTTLVNEEPSER
uniref:Uncharacterized protein n=1 Tax=Vespula pensylvanica TaxID=30213 RepID=A0A834NH88_VESPE|nr:hypothetical protein H0235_014099 [Vespula pensylvanica]